MCSAKIPESSNPAQQAAQGVSDLAGLFVGQLSPDELLVFERAIDAGLARRVYQGAAGFLGLAKVALTFPEPFPSNAPGA